MGRTKKSAEDVTTVGLKLSQSAWEELQKKAKAMGLSRSALIEKIATGEIQIGSSSQSGTRLLGKS
ncbi:ribbon-helix-helix protein, CopG family [Nostoc sp. NMS9]|uniref:ribbon-helix-helix protein, CopG family n=1 Tax=Nostoc sp. NMS9 TaxID=2815393 RepID=UPI003458F247|nr:ribbon-helix-helix protein, CopG family [Nostoc sp. NMS9]